MPEKLSTAAHAIASEQVSKELHNMYDTLSLYDCARAETYPNEYYNYSPTPSVYQIGRTFDNANDTVSIKSNYTRDDYEYYNGNESNPRSSEQKILLSMRAYDRVGIVRNVVDLMSDFTCTGVKIVHPNQAEQRFFNEWWDYIDGDMVSERFVNYLYRMANVPVTTSFGKVPVRIERKWSSANASDPALSSQPQDIPIEEIKYEHRRIPLRYNFINPLTLQVIAPDLAVFTGKMTYALRINSALRSSIGRLQYQFPGTSYKEMLDLIPAPIAQAIKEGKTIVPIDNQNMKIYYYRKDDWEVWAKPMISAILEDLVMLEKMKLADISALNGAISNVRLWKLGKMEDANPLNWVIPTKANITKVRSILANGVGGGTLDLVWGPDIDFKESNTQVHHFLGIDKYESTYKNIYEGLGVPFGNVGSNATGMTNNFIAMQTFIERLEYGRRVLENFWNEQIKIVQLAMGYTKPAKITFSKINLGDDTTYKQILLGLVDRDLLSAESMLESCGYSDLIEKIKIKRDNKKRDAGNLSKKAGPFHDPQKDPEQEMKQHLLQGGIVTPSQVGINLPEKKRGEKTGLEQQHEMKLAQDKNKARFKPRGTAGRPGGAKDSKKRKQKRPPIKTKASEFINTFMWGNAAQKRVSDIVTPIMLAQAYKKPNVRSLSEDEFQELETVKFQVFSNLEPFEDFDEARILEISKSGLSHNINVISATKVIIASFKQRYQREPIVDELRQLQATGFALAYEPEDDSAVLDNFDSVTPTELELSPVL